MNIRYLVRTRPGANSSGYLKIIRQYLFYCVNLDFNFDITVVFSRNYGIQVIVEMSKV